MMTDKKAERHELTEKFCENSNFHGIRDLYESKNAKLKCFWSAAILAAVGVVIYGCYKVLDQYSNFPLATSYVVQVETSRVLPDVLICSFTRFNATFLRQNDISPQLAQYVQTSFGVPTAHKFVKFQDYTIAEHKEYGKQLKQFLKSQNFTFIDLIKKASFSCNEYIQYCLTPDGTSDCCETAEVEFTPMGLCYRIKGPTQTGVGYGFGLTLVMRTIEPNLVASARNSVHNDGLSVKFAEANRGITYDMTFLPSGTHAIMSLKATKFEFLNMQPHHRCKENTDVGYSAARCFDSCIFEPIVETCGCSHLFTYQTANATSNTRYCTPYDVKFCIQDKVLMGQKLKMRRKVKECRVRCQAPCSYWEYNPSLSMANFPSQSIQKYTSPGQSNINFFLNQNFKKTQVYFIIEPMLFST